MLQVLLKFFLFFSNAMQSSCLQIANLTVSIGRKVFLSGTKLVEATNKNDGNATKRQIVIHDLLQTEVQNSNDLGINS